MMKLPYKKVKEIGTHDFTLNCKMDGMENKISIKFSFERERLYQILGLYRSPSVTLMNLHKTYKQRKGKYAPVIKFSLIGYREEEIPCMPMSFHGPKLFLLSHYMCVSKLTTII